nr:MAG TPA: hypothetical protein [Caudoviricetes sp.]
MSYRLYWLETIYPVGKPISSLKNSLLDFWSAKLDCK